MSGLTNNYVDWLCRQLAGSEFLGVYSCDRLESLTIPKTSFQLIINIAPSWYPYGHFVAIAYDKSKHSLLYFDSLALGFKDPNIISFLERLRKETQQSGQLQSYQSDTPIQMLSSRFCGFYAIGFVLSIKNDVKFMSKFDTPPSQKNDVQIIDFIMKYITHYS